MAKITSVHDKFFRRILSDTVVAADYFQTALPGRVADLLDFTTLERQSSSYLAAGGTQKLAGPKHAHTGRRLPILRLPAAA